MPKELLVAEETCIFLYIYIHQWLVYVSSQAYKDIKWHQTYTVKINVMYLVNGLQVITISAIAFCKMYFT